VRGSVDANPATSRAQRAAFEYFPMTDQIAQRAVEVQGLPAQHAQHRSV
jgi:hypothetical protein